MWIEYSPHDLSHNPDTENNMPTKPKAKPDLSKLDFKPVPKAVVRSVMAPFRFYFAPQFYGLEDLDVSKPAIFVTNHTILGVLDGFPFATEIYLRKGLILRGLADSMHFKIPVWRDWITNSLGAVEASRENCDIIMLRKESLVVFPGGTREVCKKRGEKYVLKWSDRRGFVRMAMKHGYDIIPVAAVGGEEAFTITKDANDILKSPFGRFLKMIGVAEKYFKNGELMRGKKESQLAQVRNEKIGFVFQFHYLLNEFSVLENVMIPGLKLNKKSRPELEHIAMENPNFFTV